MVALFRPRKGLEVLLEALAGIRNLGHDVRLTAVGPFETTAYQTQILKRVTQAGLDQAIRWRGFQSDVPRELVGCDLFVLPSLFGEGLPMVVLEAMAAGVPVVASRISGIPEAIRDGQDGLLFPAGEPAALVAVLLRVIRGEVDWQGLRVSAHARQAQDFSARNMARGVAGVYDRLRPVGISS